LNHQASKVIVKIKKASTKKTFSQLIIDQLSLIDGQPGQDFAFFDKNKK